MGSYDTPNGSITNIGGDDPIAARNHAHEEARLEITRRISAVVFAELGYDPDEMAAFSTCPVPLKTKRELVERTIAARCAAEFKAAGLAS